MKKRRDSVVPCSRGLLLFGAAALASAGLGGCDWIQDRFKAKAPEVKFAPYAENYGSKTDFAQVEAQFPLSTAELARITPENLAALDQEQIDQVYARLTAGPIPDGPYDGGILLPRGMSKRNYTGIERTFLNCAVCHTSTVRDTPEATPRIVLGMPAARFDIMGFERFFFDCATDPKFSKDFIIPEVRRLLQAQGDDLDLLDRYLVYPLAIAIMRDRLLMLRGRFGFVLKQAEQGHLWGPGRVDTFNSAKVLFNFPMEKLDPGELLGASDFPSIWNQRKKRGMEVVSRSPQQKAPLSKAGLLCECRTAWSISCAA